MQATLTELNTVYIIAHNRVFRLWWNEAGYWQIDLHTGDNTDWLYFGHGATQVIAMAQIGNAL